MSEKNKLLLLVGLFLVAFFLPIEKAGFQRAILEGFFLVKEYARQHVLLCLIPAFFIAGAIGTFITQGSVLRYLGPQAPKLVAYGVAAVSGSILAVCSCTVLPLFAGIYKRGAGFGPAIAFLYSGPAINVLALILTARVLGLELGLARALGAVSFSVVIGLAMAFLFRQDEVEQKREEGNPFAIDAGERQRTGLQDAAFLATLVAFLVFANWGAPRPGLGLFSLIAHARWYLVAVISVVILYQVSRWFMKEELQSWVEATWGFAKQILPLLFAGVLVSGWALGRPGMDAGLIPAEWVNRAVGGNSLGANLVASVVGAFMYFATLTEVPILQTLLGAGMGKGPALSLLLAGPALSLPNMLVINSYLGPRKTLAYCSLVVVMATFSGWLFGYLVG